jgi:pilus assembly protein TadC
LTFFPVWLEKKYRINIPLDFELLSFFCLCFFVFLGKSEVLRSFLVVGYFFCIALSAIALGFVGFIILFFLLKAKRITSYPGWAALFSFCFALSIGAFWEIFGILYGSAFWL